MKEKKLKKKRKSRKMRKPFSFLAARSNGMENLSRLIGFDKLEDLAKLTSLVKVKVKLLK